MKKTILSIIMMLSALTAFSQAKKPTIMVIPSDIYCEREGYVTNYQDENGTTHSSADYGRAFLSDENLRLAISELSRIMADRGFPLKDLEQTLKTMESQAAEAALFSGRGGGSIYESPLDKLKRTAKADIIMDLDFNIKSRGPQKYISFNLRGIDAYTSKVITTASGDGQPSTAVSTGILVEEAVLNYMDAFNAALQNHFDDMFANGREVTISVRMTDNCPVTMYDDFEFMGEIVALTDILDWWMDENTVNHRFTRAGGGDYYTDYEQVRIPLYKTVLGKERAIDTRSFAMDLARFLNKEPFNLPYSINERGLGNVWIVLGD
ncbi:MAG TPA: hypothetical protein IAC04_05130 [Candidatus Coprenecus stercoravium]|uniref:Uncharacterized protein n=1 Tax=Candidatus Coprenecus stercoravium TaxID=2840735 RepID=A0A9D2GR53_9BACT|nr:hypothetical protein [Candidatus Coprenecus stercoravium]